MTQLPAAARSALTLAVLSLLLVVGLVWGWSAATQPLPESATSPGGCTPTTLEAGEKLYPDQVQVSVLNAGERGSFASRVLAQLTARGYAEGRSGNAPSDAEVQRVQVWAPDRSAPEVQLVLSTLGKKVPVVDRGVTAPGVVVVVGDRFDKVRKGRKNVTVAKSVEICVPPPRVS
ncbi:hypothetical protein I601_1515 [Nocardioides dokdonensis FR1436]|uniref:LytR/CpsA/Psr regulator C-terminal domain-containing protein n=1 Tax=Nocardioides dokdonensis FR1436 TaxID=1300347 RepID=A0A1A9GJU6_9ACTN|nr:LytR C-terminal domain-containing protein [Nocardioides dokdonensis]ANH37950.1 hypothetical protein I601_1515 [Nocardioides dokdonensis FR1436]